MSVLDELNSLERRAIARSDNDDYVDGHKDAIDEAREVVRRLGLAESHTPAPAGKGD
ncbi:MAG: hypothetical protein ACOC8P_00395 [Dichotomicrobium sp.]